MEHNWDLYFDTSSEYWKQLQEIYEKNDHFPKIIAKNRNLHHKFMRSFSKLEGVPIDNDKDNLVSLSLPDHLRVHFYLYKCTKVGFRNRTAAPVRFMIKKALSHITDETIEQIIEDWDDSIMHYGPSKEAREKMSRAKKGVPRSDEVKQKLREHNGMKKPEVAQAHAEFMKGNQFHNKKVQCIETGIVYKSAKEAATKNSCCRSSICLACKGIYKTAKSYHWRYV